GQAIAVALEERAVPHRVVGEAALFQRAEIRDLLSWLRLLADASNAAAVVRALARSPIELRSVDIARCTQIARRRKLDMVAELASAYARRSPQATPREFACSIAAVADSGLREQDEPGLSGAREVQIVSLDGGFALEAGHVYVVGLHGGLAAPAPERIPQALMP